MTADRLINSYNIVDTTLYGRNEEMIDLKSLLIEFAQHHCEKALEAVTENHECKFDWELDIPVLVKQSVLNAYPKENIK